MKKSVFGLINKSEELDDGTLKVWGIASSSNEDSDGEIITAEAMKNALTDYMKFGAIREMHGSNAAGTALEIAVDEATGFTHICALIVDPVAILKIKTGVYKAWSIGGKVLKRVKNIITELKLVEVSLVDRPANPDAVFTMYKAEIIDNEQQISDNLEKEENMPQNNEENKPDSNIQEENQENNSQIDKSQENKDIKKSLSDVSWLSSLVQELVWLQECMQYETEWEKDGSKLPEDLKNIIKQLGDLLIASAKEETEELIGNDSEKSANNQDLNKSVSLDEKIVKQIYSLALQLQPKDLNKSESTEELAKFSEVKNDLEKALKEKEELTKRIKELESMPANPKAVLHTPSKESDLGKSQTSEDKVIKNERGEVDEVATAILKAQQNPSFVKF